MSAPTPDLHYNSDSDEEEEEEAFLTWFTNRVRKAAPRLTNCVSVCVMKTWLLSGSFEPACAKRSCAFKNFESGVILGINKAGKLNLVSLLYFFVGSMTKT